MNDKSHFKIGITRIEHLALLLKIDQELLNYYSANKNKNIKKIILKQVKNGKTKERPVYNTTDQYKYILKSINKKLLKKYNFPPGIFGAISGKSISDMVNIHIKKEAVFSLDLKNFFPSIESGRIFNFFKKTGCTNEISGILTDLVTYKGSLPQGFPTSPMLANIMAVDLDFEHLKVCKKFNLSRTRWIDDIVISGRSKDIIPNINTFIGLIKGNNFQTSNHKTVFKHRSENPTVLGLEVFKNKPSIPKAIIQKVEDLLLECLYNGVYHVQEQYDTDYFGNKKNIMLSLKGKIDYIAKFNPKEARELYKLHNQVFKI